MTQNQADATVLTGPDLRPRRWRTAILRLAGTMLLGGGLIPEGGHVPNHLTKALPRQDIQLDFRHIEYRTL